jgi:pimeloyl-ACP methyl ester carboxylesterase
MSTPTSHSLNVPGARLYYEVQGSGPTLMLVGHPMGAAGFTAIAPLPAVDYTVVTYDPRGFARSTVDDPDQDAEPDLLADDVRRVLEAVGNKPAYVFGSSGGAITGLALVAGYPDHVRALVAHEPPLALLLPDAEEARAGMEDIYETYRESRDRAAWQRFSTFTGMNVGPQSAETAPQPPSPEAVATSGRDRTC